MHIKFAPEFRGTSIRSYYAKGVATLYILALSFVFSASSGSPEPLQNLRTIEPVQLSDFELKALDGRLVVLLVHFFATWCEPCRTEFASLATLVASGRKMAILAINVAETPSRVRRFAETEHIVLPILLDVDRKVAKACGVTVLLTTFVLDRNNTTRLSVEGDLNWSRQDVLAALDETLHPPPTNPQKQKNTTNQGEIE